MTLEVSETPKKRTQLARASHYDRGKFVPLLTQSMPDRFENGRKILTTTTISHIHDLCYDPLTDQIWGITRSGANPNYIIRINRQTGAYNTINIGVAGENKGMACCYALEHVWFAILSSPARIIKLNPRDNSYETFEMDAGENLGTSICFDGQYIWMGLNLTPARLIRFNPNDNTHTTYTMNVNENLFYWLLWDGTYVWAVGVVGAAISAGILVRFNPADNTHVTYALGVGNECPHHIAFDGDNIWLAVSAGRAFIKFDIDSATFETYNTDKSTATRYQPYLVEFDGRYIWGALTVPATLYRFSPEESSYAIIDLPDDLDELHAICFDGSHLWLANYADPACFIKFNPFIGTQSIGLIKFDGAQTTMGASTTRYVDTNGLSVAENVTQIPIGDNITAMTLSAQIITNTRADTSGIGLRRNGVLLTPYILIGAGATGTFHVLVLARFSEGDLMSVRAWTSGGAGNIDMGKVTVTTI